MLHHADVFSAVGLCAGMFAARPFHRALSCTAEYVVACQAYTSVCLTLHQATQYVGFQVFTCCTVCVLQFLAAFVCFDNFASSTRVQSELFGGIACISCIVITDVCNQVQLQFSVSCFSCQHLWV